MPTTLEQDLEKLDTLAYHRREYSEGDLRRYHALLRKKGRAALAALDLIYRWMLVPSTIWPLHIQDVFGACLTSLEAGNPLDADMLFLLKMLPEPPSENVCTVVAEHEHLVQFGSYESLVEKIEKYDFIEKEAQRNQVLLREWKSIKAHWDVTRYVDQKGIIRRSLTGERNIRPQFSIDWNDANHRFQAAFDAFCIRWTLYGMKGDKPLTMKLSVNLTALGTMIFIPAYWSLDGKRDIIWSKVNKLHRARSLKKQGASLAKGVEDRRGYAVKLRELDAEVKRLGLRGEKKINFLFKGLNWDLGTSPKRLSLLRREFPEEFL